jgi:hypothetical protein
MKRCKRCGGSLCAERFEDANGGGYVLTCLCCAEAQEIYEWRRSLSMTAEQFVELGQPSRRGRPRKDAR